MSIAIKSGTSEDKATVTSDNALKVAARLTDASGAPVALRPDGFLRVAADPSSLFVDNFETFNAADWSVIGGVPVLAAGLLALPAGTIPGGGTLMRSVPVFPLPGSAFLQASAVFALDATPVLGNKRFFGLGLLAAAPTAAVPLSSGVVFEVSDVDGALYGAVYAGGARTATVPLTRPTDGALHRYAVYYRTSRVYFEIDGATAGSIDAPNLPISTMAVLAGSANVTGQAVAPAFTLSAVAVADTGRNSLQLADGTRPYLKAQVGRSAGLAIMGARPAATTATVAAAATGTLGPVDVSEAATVAFLVKAQTPASGWTGSPVVVFEQSDDTVQWAPLFVTRADTNLAAATQVLGAGAANTAVAFIASVPPTAMWVRARVTTGTATGALTLSAQTGGLPATPSVVIATPARTPVTISGVALAVGTSGTETLLTLAHERFPAAAVNATSYLVPAGRRLRIQNMVFTQVGNSTAAAATSIFRIRYNPAGAVTTTSAPILLPARLASPSQATSFQQLPVPIPEGFDITGDGVGQFGITVTTTWTLNAPTVDVLIVGYEY